MKGHIVQRYKSSFTIIITLPRDPHTGRYPRIVRSFKGINKTQARQIMDDMMTQLRTGTYVPPQKTMVQEYLETWLESRKPRLAPKTYQGYELYIRKHVGPVLGSRRIQDVTTLDIDRLYAALGKTVSQRTVERVHEMLHAAFKRARKQRLIQFNPCEDAEAPRATSPETRPIKAEEVPALLDAARGSPIEDLITLALHTGARRGELLALRWEDVDLGAGLITFRHGYTRVEGVDHIRQPKSRKGRLHIPTPTALALLERRKTFAGHDLVFCRKDGRPLDPSTVTHQFKRVAKKAGLPDLQFKGLRHGHGSILQAAGVGLKSIQDRLGHETIAMTGDVYTHVDIAVQRRVAETFEEIISHRFRTGSNDSGNMSTGSDPRIH